MDIQKQVEAVVAKWFMRAGVAVVLGGLSLAFGFGFWMATLQADVNRALSFNDPLLAKLVQQHEWLIQDHEKRLVRVETRP